MSPEKYRRTFVARPEGAALRLVSGPVRPECAGRVMSIRLEAATRPMRQVPERPHDPSLVVMPELTERRRAFAPVEAMAVPAAERGTAPDAVAQILGAWNLAHGF